MDLRPFQRKFVKAALRLPPSGHGGAIVWPRGSLGKSLVWRRICSDEVFDSG